jgi:hypothetical protein
LEVTNSGGGKLLLLGVIKSERTFPVAHQPVPAAHRSSHFLYKQRNHEAALPANKMCLAAAAGVGPCHSRSTSVHLERRHIR